MERHFDQELARIRQQLLEMAGIVEEMIGEAMRALTERDSTLAQATIERDREVDRLEKSIDQIGLTFDFKNRPKASDIFTSEYLPPAAERKL